MTSQEAIDAGIPAVTLPLAPGVPVSNDPLAAMENESIFDALDTSTDNTGIHVTVHPSTSYWPLLLLLASTLYLFHNRNH